MKRLTLLFALLIMTYQTHSQTASDTLSQPRIALVLSGGGALGYAHIGVLQALDEAGIRPSYISGTSMGALVGVLYAQGYSANTLYDFVVSRRLHNIIRNVNASILNVNRGLGDFKHVRQLLNDAIPHDSFDSLQIPFLCVATEVGSGALAVRSSGNNLADWVLASASIPVVFKPQLIEGKYYCDGGFVDNLPARQVPKEAYDICIGIDLVPTQLPMAKDYFSRHYLINDVYGSMILNINSQQGRQYCDYLITPHHDVKYGVLDFRHYDILRQRGYDAMWQWLNTHWH